MSIKYSDNGFEPKDMKWFPLKHKFQIIIIVDFE